MPGIHDGRVYIVTGASTGLGLASADALVDRGGRVVLVARDAGRLARAIDGRSGRMIACPGDLNDPELAGLAVHAAQSAFGRLDGALISVGGPPPGSVLSTSDAEWMQAFQTIFLGAVRMARVCAGVLGPSGAIGLVLSTSAREVFPGLAISNGLRPGLAMLVKDLADEVGPRGVRVFGLLPGRIATDRLRGFDDAAGPGSRERTEAEIPLRRYGEPAEFGAVAAFLLGPEASYITGCVIPVDGGSLRSP